MPEASASDAAPALPPVPLVEGPLAPRVQYPTAGALVASRDSNFIFGSVGNGGAALTINGVRVPVLLNGSWLAFLPVPATARYDLVASLGSDTVRLEHAVRVLPPRPRLIATGSLVVDSASVAPGPGGTIALPDDERVRVSVRAPANAEAWVLYGDSGAAGRPRQALVNAGGSPPGSTSSDGTPGRYLGDPELWATDLRAAQLRRGGTVVIARGADTVRLAVSVVAPAADSLPRWALIGAEASAVSDTDRVIVARPTPGGTYKWFLLPGTQVEATGRIGDFTRIRLDDALEVWVGSSDVRPLPAGFAAPRRVAAGARLVPAHGWVDLFIPMRERPPYMVEQRENELVLTLYGTQATTDILSYAGNDSLVRVVTWEPVASDRARYTLRLSSAPFGYIVFWDRGAFVLRLRRPPAVDQRSPLRGLTIAVDAGHPPVGATGPTGLYEAEPALAIALQTKTLLEARGATVVMTRTSPAPVALRDRPIIARRANAHALVSIHLNALPDGVNPFTAHGTGTYFFHPQAEPLARAVQEGMVARMGLRNLGIFYNNLALARPTWMPSILCEGAFIMIPEQEAALRTPVFQAAYARGVADGIESYFRSLGQSR
ncbi:MAG: N-acetylmuramoyl-L-alanine amidase [Gemmatimonadota bacterium]|nr:N-acetylmuramoyl-L-alanine amidase [Gemmatimonadota bacterium]